MGGYYPANTGLCTSGATVYNASKAAAFADLDLSAYVGARVALCIIKITNSTGGAMQLLFRPNGDVGNYDGYNNASYVGIPNGQSGFGTIITANDGIVEWYSTNAAGTVKIELIAYIV